MIAYFFAECKEKWSIIVLLYDWTTHKRKSDTVRCLSFENAHNPPPNSPFILAPRWWRSTCWVVDDILASYPYEWSLYSQYLYLSYLFSPRRFWKITFTIFEYAHHWSMYLSFCSYYISRFLKYGIYFGIPHGGCVCISTYSSHYFSCHKNWSYYR